MFRPQARAIGARHSAEHAVAGRDLLPRQRRQRQQLAAQPRPRPAVKRHLDGIERWPDGLRGEARVVQAHSLGLEHGTSRNQHVGAAIRVAKRRRACKESACAAVPEVADVEDSIDHTW